MEAVPDVISPVDHFQQALAHFDDGRLIKTTRDYLWRANAGPQADRDQCTERAQSCLAECERRGLAVPD